MSYLKYKTRGKVTPQGKPKVYFCCHPKDFGLYFETISDEILSKQNCSVWYTDGEIVDFEEHLTDLKEMQLFVMPVTSELLNMPNYALEVEFPFANENHIPVLPLMQENGLEEVFNTKCGDLQFLDKHNTDVTAISYNEKLGKYLSSVLIGDELAEKIRAAFDAYVFLSYRKKDRKYAQELMRLIHKNDFCRDIAIWYDEFLTPGENFNDSIKDALQKSGLFVLTVTPNLINEKNYIMTTEYPMAKKEGKRVLPAELVPTDKMQLSEKYEGIPVCTDAHNDAELTNALLEAIRSMAIKENDASPEHNFFIGLAYLGGVDVEVDHDRAVSLITSAAEEGLAEAVDKLVEMYRTGLGVERSYETGILWQKKKIALAEASYNDNPTADNLNDLFWELITCGYYYQELGKLAEAKEQYAAALEYMEKSDYTESRLNIRCDLSVGYIKLGDILKAESKLPQARECYEKSLKLSEALAEETGRVEARRNLSISYNRLGDVFKAEGKPQQALEYYEKSLELSKALAEETGTVVSRRDLSISYNNLGDIFKAEGKLPEAREYYEKALELREALAEETGTVEARRDLSASYNRLGDVFRAEGKLPQALEYYEKSLELDEALAAETGTVEARRDLSISYNNLGDVFRAEGKLPQAREYYEKALELRDALAAETGTVEARRDLSASYNRLGDVFQAEGKLPQAREYYEKLLELSEELAEETGTVEARSDLSISYNRLGGIFKAEGKLPQAREYYEKALELSEALAEETGTVEARRDLSISYYRLGDVFKAEAQRDMSVSYNRFRDVLKAGDKLLQAREYYEKSLELCQALADETGMKKDIVALALAYYSLYTVSVFRRKKYLKKAISIAELLCRQCPDDAQNQELLQFLKSL